MTKNVKRTVVWNGSHNLFHWDPKILKVIRISVFSYLVQSFRISARVFSGFRGQESLRIPPAIRSNTNKYNKLAMCYKIWFLWMMINAKMMCTWRFSVSEVFGSIHSCETSPVGFQTFRLGIIDYPPELLKRMAFTYWSYDKTEMINLIKRSEQNWSRRPPARIKCAGCVIFLPIRPHASRNEPQRSWTKSLIRVHRCGRALLTMFNWSKLSVTNGNEIILKANENCG